MVQRIWLSREPDQTIVEHVNFEGAVARDQHVAPQVVLKPIDQVWVHNVATSQYSVLVAHVLLSVYDFDASSLRGSHWLQDVQSFLVFGQLTIRSEQVILLRQYKAHRGDAELLGKLDSESVHVFPQKVFATQLHAAWEMVGFLVLVEVLDIGWQDVSCPLQVKHVTALATVYHVKSRALTTVDHRVVDVSIVADFERHKQILDFFPFVPTDALALALDLHVGWIREKRCRWSVLENRLQKGGKLSMRLEHRVR